MDLPSGYPDEFYPGFAAPVVVKSHQTGRVACGLARFGLIPSWSKDEKISRHTYNARSETAAEKPSYRAAWRHRQYGLVLVDNFYEPSYESGRAVRWKIELASGDPFGIACLWDRWTDPTSGELVVSFSMLTVNADEHHHLHFHGCPLWKTEHPAKAQFWRGFVFFRVDFGSHKTRFFGLPRPVLALYSPKSLDERGQHPHARFLINQGLTSAVTFPFFYRSAGAI